MKQYIAFSGGKDSTAMLLRMIELNEPIDGIFFADTGEEWPELYAYIQRIQKHIKREITILPPPYTIKEGIRKKITRGKRKGQYRGYPLALSPCYFMRDAKLIPQQRLQKDGITCVGIASDEKQRVQKNTKLRYPLIEWGWTEQSCVDYLNKKGLLNPLYQNFKRIGCKACPKQSRGSLWLIWKYDPKTWQYIYDLNDFNKKITGNEIMFLDGTFSMVEDMFKKGYKPKVEEGYACFQCEGVKKFVTGQVKLSEFESCQ